MAFSRGFKKCSRLDRIRNEDIRKELRDVNDKFRSDDGRNIVAKCRNQDWLNKSGSITYVGHRFVG